MEDFLEGKNPDQELMKNIPPGYRLVSIDEKLEMFDVSTRAVILHEELKVLERDRELAQVRIEVLRGNIDKIQRELEDKRIVLARAKTKLFEVRHKFGFLDTDQECVVTDKNGVTYFRLPKEQT